MDDGCLLGSLELAALALDVGLPHPAQRRVNRLLHGRNPWRRRSLRRSDCNSAAVFVDDFGRRKQRYLEHGICSPPGASREDKTATQNGIPEAVLVL